MLSRLSRRKRREETVVKHAVRETVCVCAVCSQLRVGTDVHIAAETHSRVNSTFYIYSTQSIDNLDYYSNCIRKAFIFTNGKFMVFFLFHQITGVECLCD